MHTQFAYSRQYLLAPGASSDAKPSAKRLKAGAAATSPAAGMAAGEPGVSQTRARLASLLARVSSRRLYGVVHDAHRQVAERARGIDSAGAAVPWRGQRDPRVRLQACGLAMRVLKRLRGVHDELVERDLGHRHTRSGASRDAANAAPFGDAAGVIGWLAPALPQEQDKAMAQLGIILVYLSSKLNDNSSVSLSVVVLDARTRLTPSARAVSQRARADSKFVQVVHQAIMRSPCFADSSRPLDTIRELECRTLALLKFDITRCDSAESQTPTRCRCCVEE